MSTHCHTQAVLNHNQKALTFCPQPAQQAAKSQERIVCLHCMLWDIPQAREQILVIRSSVGWAVLLQNTGDEENLRFGTAHPTNHCR